MDGMKLIGKWTEDDDFGEIYIDSVPREYDPNYLIIALNERIDGKTSFQSIAIDREDAKNITEILNRFICSKMMNKIKRI